MKIKGKVIHGIQQGRILGFPTANFLADEILESGIYAGKIIFNEKEYNAAVYSPGNKVVEAFIVDFFGDLYDEEIEIEIVKKIRERKNFKNKEEAKEQIEQDVAMIKEFFK